MKIATRLSFVPSLLVWNVRDSSINYRAYRLPYAAKLSCVVEGERFLPPLLSELIKTEDYISFFEKTIAQDNFFIF